MELTNPAQMQPSPTSTETGAGEVDLALGPGRESVLEGPHEVAPGKAPGRFHFGRARRPCGASHFGTSPGYPATASVDAANGAIRSSCHASDRRTW